MTVPFSRLLTLIVIAVVLAIPVGPAAAGKPFDHAKLAQSAIDRHIRPGYVRLADAAALMAQAMIGHCGTHSTPRREIEAAYDSLVTAWGRVEHIDFGPIAADNRRERIFFWPDRRGLGAQQVAKALRGADDSVLDADRLAGKSVALQGLGALEVVLFGSGAAEAVTGGHRCRFAVAVATQLARLTRTLSDEWREPDGYARDWLHPGEGNRHYLRPSETTLALAKAYDRGLERVRDARIAGPLGLTRDRRTTRAPLHVSGRSMRLVAANLEGLSELLGAAGLKAAIVETGLEHPSISIAANADLITRELKTAQDVATALEGAARPFEDEKSRKRMIAMGFPLKNARIQAVALIELTSDISLSFNASDGD